MKRRTFLKVIGLAGVSSILPFNKNIFADTFPTLPIPGLVKPDADGRIRLKIQKGRMQWVGKPTETWGYNGPLLGPALWLQRGRKVFLEVENTLPEDTSVHCHGLEIPGIADGGPQSPIAPGGTWKTELAIDQPAATCWFHPHPHRKTGRHVAMGLAGLLLVNDEKSEQLPLPKTWGVDDVPVILQDKRLNAAGQIDYALDVVSAAVGWFGDMMLTNGSLYPQHIAPRGWLRLRLLNGCNARSLHITASDGRPMYVIASDGGFLSEPVKMTELPLVMGERFEVLVDLRDGKPFDLLTLPVEQMGMALPPFDNPLPVLRIQPSQDSGQGRLPGQLALLPPLPKLDGLMTRTLELSMDHRLNMLGMMQLRQRYGRAGMDGMGMGGMGMMGGMGGMGGRMMNSEPFDIWHGNFINGQAFEMDSPMFDVKKDQYERWVIFSAMGMMLHSFHIHGTQFRILSENGVPPQPHCSGFKDTIRVDGRRENEVLVRFAHPAPREHSYMAHCHLLEHEDTGMMMSFTVTG